MIKVAILKTDGALALEEETFLFVSDSVKEKIKETKNKEQREHRIGAYLLLNSLLGEKVQTTCQ